MGAFDDLLIIDNFAGGGGASTGIERALGRSPDVAINHDAEAVALHAANHPDTLHLCQNVWKADPRDVVRRASERRCAALGIPFRELPVGFAWFSPDCKHFSKAKGSKPVEKGIRDLAWVVVHWAKLTLPNIIALENVEEFKDWGPLIDAEDGKRVPCPVSKGLTFKRWVRELKRLGYVVDFRELRACDYGAPTIRKRLFVVARRDGKPITWAAPSHAKPGPDGSVAGGLQPWRTAAECIDWDLDCPSIFGRGRQVWNKQEQVFEWIDKPLAENTLRRVARGVMRYVVNAEKPFIVGVGGRMGQSPERPVDVPVQTLTAKADSALVMPLTHQGADRAHKTDEPFKTVTAAHRGEMAVVQPFIARIGQTGGGGKYVNGIDEPVTTITSKAEHLVIAPHVTKFRGGATGSAADEPMPTVTANSFVKRPGGAAPLGLVSATLVQTGYGERPGQAPRTMDIEKPLGTAVAGGAKHALVSAFMAQHNTGNDGHDMREPVSTIVGKGCTQGVVEAKAAILSHQYGSGGGDGDPAQPARTVTATGQHHAVVECDLSAEDLEGAQRVVAFIAKYYGQGDGQPVDEPLHTVTTKDRFCLLMVRGLPIVDIGLRMLQPRELYRAQGFPADYRIDGPGPNGKPMTKTAQVRMCGNSVCPPIAQAIAHALVFSPSVEAVAGAAD